MALICRYTVMENPSRASNIIDQPQWLTDHKSSMLAHYTDLIQQPGCKEYAEHRLKELEAGELCKGITKRIRADIAKAPQTDLGN